MALLQKWPKPGKSAKVWSMKKNTKKRTRGSKKRKYRVRNWKDYNAALVQRGSLTIWVSPAALANWYEAGSSGKRGAPRTFSEMTVHCMATLGEVYRLPLRGTEGLLGSIVQLLGVPVEVPDYSTLCRRRRELAIELPRRVRGEPLHLVVDATGVKIYGEGEWKVRQHGTSRRRTWRKLHVGIDEASGEIVAAVVTTNDLTDGEILPDLLAQVAEPLAQVSGDGAYDKWKCYEAIAARGARAVIPPQRNAKIKQHGNIKAPPLPRDENLRRLRRVGRRRWKEESQYHRRSLAETGIFRLKTIFGERVRAQSFTGQAAQLLLRCAALNRMTHLGMPVSVAL